MSVTRFAKHLIEVVLAVGTLYIAYVTLYPGAVALGNASSKKAVHVEIRPTIGWAMHSSWSGGFIRPSRLK